MTAVNHPASAARPVATSSAPAVWDDTHLPFRTAFHVFAAARPLTTPLASRLLGAFLDAVRASRLPEDALPLARDYYRKALARPGYFLHHFAPFLPLADRTFDIPTRRPHLLDLGCGLGLQACLLGARGADITGIDNDADRIRAAHALARWITSQTDTANRPAFHAADAFTFLRAAPPAAFDGLYTQFALAYMQPQRDMLGLIDRVVRPGGRILIAETNTASLLNRFVRRRPWLTFRHYLAVARTMNWKLIDMHFRWVLPAPLIEPAGLRPLTTRLDRFLERLPGARLITGSLILIFSRPA